MHFDHDQSYAQPSNSFIQQSRTLNKVQYLADCDVFIKQQPKCLNLNVAKPSQLHSMCEVVSDACLHPSHLGLFTSPSLNRCFLDDMYAT